MSNNAPNACPRCRSVNCNDPDSKACSDNCIARLYARLVQPVPMLLYCPQCYAQHIDAPAPGWDNRPHATHTCGACGLAWRPSNTATTGVATLPALEAHHAERIKAAAPFGVVLLQRMAALILSIRKNAPPALAEAIITDAVIKRE